MRNNRIEWNKLEFVIYKIKTYKPQINALLYGMYSIWQGVLPLQEGINDYMERI